MTNKSIIEAGQSMIMNIPKFGDKDVILNITDRKYDHEPPYVLVSVVDLENHKQLASGKAVIYADHRLGTEFITPQCLDRIPVPATALEPPAFGEFQNTTPARNYTGQISDPDPSDPDPSDPDPSDPDPSDPDPIPVPVPVPDPDPIPVPVPVPDPTPNSKWVTFVYDNDRENNPIPIGLETNLPLAFPPYKEVYDELIDENTDIVPYREWLTDPQQADRFDALLDETLKDISQGSSEIDKIKPLWEACVETWNKSKENTEALETKSSELKQGLAEATLKADFPEISRIASELQILSDDLKTSTSKMEEHLNNKVRLEADAITWLTDSLKHYENTFLKGVAELVNGKRPQNTPEPDPSDPIPPTPSKPSKPVPPSPTGNYHTVKFGKIEVFDALKYTEDELREFGKASVTATAVRDWSSATFGTMSKIPVPKQYKNLGVIDQAILYICAGLDVYFYGRAGIGKSYGVEQACKILGAKLFIVAKPKTYQITGGLTVSGEPAPSLLQEAIDYATTHPDELVVILVDEADRMDASASQTMNTVLASRVITNSKENILVPDNVRFMATGNSNGTGSREYKAEPMDKSLLDRFIAVPVTIDEKTVKSLADDEEFSEFFLSLYRLLVDRKLESFVVSYRGIESFGRLKMFLPEIDALERAITKGQDRKTLSGLVDALPTGNRFTDMFKKIGDRS